MKVDDFVTTGSEMNAAQQDLASTHMTDAVNSGIVGSADKSAMAIKADVMSSSSGTAAQQGAKKVVSTETAVSKASSMLQKQGSQLATDSVVNSKLTHRKLLSKANAKNAVKNAAIASTLEGSEFEGADDMFYKGKSAYKLGRKGASALQGKLGKKAAVDVSSGAGTAKKLGGLSEKKSMLKKSAESVQRKWQLIRNQQKVTRTATAAKSAGGSITRTAAVKGGTGGIGAMLGGVSAPILAGLALLLFFVVIIGAAAGSQMSSSTSGFGPLFYWLEYETGSTDDSAFDCVTLNDGVGGQAYGMQFDTKYDLQPFLQYYLSKSDSISFGVKDNAIVMAQATYYAHCPKGLLYANSQDSGLPLIWHYLYKYDKDNFIQAQKDFVVEKTLNPAIANLEAKGYDFSKRSDVCKGAVLSWVHQHGHLYATQLRAAGITNDDSDEEFLDKLYAYRIKKFGHWGGLKLYQRYEKEVVTAKSFLYTSTGTSSSETVNRALGKLGCAYVWGAAGPNTYDCSGLVGYALTGVEGNHWCTTSTIMSQSAGFKKISASEAQPGDIVCNSHHCGIYYGNGQMIHAPHTGDVVKIGKVHSGMQYFRYTK